jgi:hydroxymethylbilane synthase
MLAWMGSRIKTMHLIFATRPSALALWQTHYVMDLLQAAWPGLSCQAQVIATSGDRILDRPLPEIGGKGLFTSELEAGLLSGVVHAAVHSLKDLPVKAVPDLVLAAIPRRGEMRDVLVSARAYLLESLPEQACVGTSSLRRAAQLLALRPDLNIQSLRGNVDTRVKKARQGQYDAILLAGAGLVRLGMQAEITQWLPLDLVAPAPGQGALAVQCRADDQETRRMLAVLDDRDTRLAVTAERAFSSALDAGCSLPVGAYARIADGVIELNGVVASQDGRRVIRLQERGTQAGALGASMAARALAQGAAQVLAVGPAQGARR